VPLACDMNHDQSVDGDDIAFFVDYLLNGGAGWDDVCSGDLDAPTGLDFDDVDDFVTCLLT